MSSSWVAASQTHVRSQLASPGLGGDLTRLNSSSLRSAAVTCRTGQARTLARSHARTSHTRRLHTEPRRPRGCCHAHPSQPPSQQAHAGLRCSTSSTSSTSKRAFKLAVQQLCDVDVCGGVYLKTAVSVSRIARHASDDADDPDADKHICNSPGSAPSNVHTPEKDPGR